MKVATVTIARLFNIASLIPGEDGALAAWNAGYALAQRTLHGDDEWECLAYYIRAREITRRSIRQGNYHPRFKRKSEPSGQCETAGYSHACGYHD